MLVENNIFLSIKKHQPNKRIPRLRKGKLCFFGQKKNKKKDGKIDNSPHLIERFFFSLRCGKNPQLQNNGLEVGEEKQGGCGCDPQSLTWRIIPFGKWLGAPKGHFVPWSRLSRFVGGWETSHL